MIVLLAAALLVQDPPARSNHSVTLDTDRALPAFAEAHGNEEIGTLGLNLCKRRPDFAALSRLKSVETLVLTGFERSEPRKQDGKWAFAVGLSDQQVAEIAKLSTLTRLELWYASLSDAQRKLLAEKLPKCELRENLNKL